MLVWCAPVQRILELNGLNLILNFHWNLRYQNQARFATFYHFFFSYLARPVILSSYFISCKTVRVARKLINLTPRLLTFNCEFLYKDKMR